MSATSICFDLLILVFATFPLQRMQKKADTWGGFQSQRMCPILLLITSRPKSPLLGVWHGKRSKAISTGNKRRIVPHLLSFLNTAPL